MTIAMRPSGPAPRHLVAAGCVLVALSGALMWWLPAGTSDNGAVYDPLAEVCIVAPALPYDPSSGLALDAPRALPDDARCPVCGMFPARYPAWAAQVIFRDGATHFFDSPVNLMVFLRDPSRFSNYTAEEVLAAYVNDVPSGSWTPAAKAFFVHGSNALGPMREGNLPAFTGRDAAERFASERGGVVLTLPDIGTDILNTLVTSVHHQHH